MQAQFSMCACIYTNHLLKSPSPPTHPFIHPSARKKQLQNQQIFYKSLYAAYFQDKSSTHFNFHLDQTILTTTEMKAYTRVLLHASQA